MEALALDRESFSRLVHLSTGHNSFLRHQYLLNEAHTEQCRLCGDGAESSEHLMLACPVLRELQWDTFGKSLPDATDIPSLGPSRVAALHYNITSRMEQ